MMLEPAINRNAVRAAKNPDRRLIPAARYTTDNKPVVDEVYEAFLSTLDPRGESSNSESVRLALGSANDQRYRNFLALISHPTYKRAPLSRLAAMCEITLREFNEWTNSAHNQRALANAFSILPEVMKGVGNAALPEEVLCTRCDGFGWLYVDLGLPKELLPKGTRVVTVKVETEAGWVDAERRVRDCPPCRGTGWTLEGPDRAQSIEKLLDMTGNSGKGKSAAAVQITQNFGGMGINSQQGQLAHITFDVDPVEPETQEPVEQQQETQESD